MFDGGRFIYIATDSPLQQPQIKHVSRLLENCIPHVTSNFHTRTLRFIVKNPFSNHFNGQVRHVQSIIMKPAYVKFQASIFQFGTRVRFVEGLAYTIVYSFQVSKLVNQAHKSRHKRLPNTPQSEILFDLSPGDNEIVLSVKPTEVSVVSQLHISGNSFSSTSRKRTILRLFPPLRFKCRVMAPGRVLLAGLFALGALNLTIGSFAHLD